MKTENRQILAVYLVVIFIALILISLTSCSILKKNKFQQRAIIDSTAFTHQENTHVNKQNEAQKSYLNEKDSKASGVTFYPVPCPDSSNKIILHVDGSIEAKGSIKDAWNNTKKETTKKDSSGKSSVDSFRYVNTTLAITKNNIITKTQVVTKYVMPWYVWLILIAVGLYWLIKLGLWAYKKWMQRFTIIP